jgi:hypothetical protein
MAAARGGSPGSLPEIGSRLAPMTAAWPYTSPMLVSHSLGDEQPGASINR